LVGYTSEEGSILQADTVSSIGRRFYTSSSHSF